MESLKDKLYQWSQHTYRETFEQRLQENRYGNPQSQEIAMMKKVLDNQWLSDKDMGGSSTRRLDKTEGEVGDFKYVSVFNAISQASDWTPADMIYGVCYLAERHPDVERKANDWSMTKEELITKMCGRALRALPSYIREIDLKQQLEKRFPNATFEQNERLDTQSHADLKMTFNGEDYYFWSFVTTDGGIENLQDKFFGHRQGDIPDGNHVLCPFDLRNSASIKGWKLYSEDQMDHVAKMIKGQQYAHYENIEQQHSGDISYFKDPHIISKDSSRELEISITR